jgi:NTP pyrophosphatase (non-canonical NTP hydrolase)
MTAGWELNCWTPMTRPLDIKHLGKLAEEAGELGSAIARCLIQGIDEREPITAKRNRDWLEEEIADVLANIDLVSEHFGLDKMRMAKRAAAKHHHLRKWHAMLEGE